MGPFLFDYVVLAIQAAQVCNGSIQGAVRAAVLRWAGYWCTIRHHISTSRLLTRLGIEPLEAYYHRRLLRWAGHVSRMPLNRLSRMPLAGWVANPRPLGCPQMTWGRTLKKTLSSNGLPSDFAAWHQLAADNARGNKSVGDQLARCQVLSSTGKPSGRSSGMAQRRPNENLN